MLILVLTDPQTDTWEPLNPMIMPRCEFGLCAIGGVLVALGGWVGEDIGSTMECYDPVNIQLFCQYIIITWFFSAGQKYLDTNGRIA